MSVSGMDVSDAMDGGRGAGTGTGVDADQDAGKG